MGDVAELAAAYALGALVGAGLWHACRRVFDGAAFARTNYRDHPLPTGVGLVLPLVVGAVVGGHAALFVEGGVGLSGSGWFALGRWGPATVEIALAFSFLGLLDDLGGVGESGGFRGHLRALAGGRVTTGMLKLLGGPLLAFAILAGAGTGTGRLGLVRDVALVCAAANLGNLFDRAPGRANKVSQLVAVGALIAADVRLVPVMVVLGAALALLGGDLGERFMLGDAGANALGAVGGLAAVVATGPTVRWIVLGVLVGLNLLSEVVSFSKVIDATPPLRALDRLGSRRGA